MRGGFWEIVLIVLLVLILFGSAKIPAMARNIANGIKTFKKEIKDEPVKKQTVKKKKTPVKKSK
ncbi:MAG: twin-arginine translocase TatA/TatE family subunit [Alphaproteobacteria bacterium]|nr:twin-arginine translocase TatA/TatE family subunit [Alphaproteobacteria bacterium]